MDIIDLHPSEDFSHRFFIWHEWLQVNGPLTPDNVFEYFASSMFYDKQSNNQVLRMQTMHSGVPLHNEAEELRRFTGIEFALVHSQPPSFFVIQKRERFSPDEVNPLADYFIMNNRIYESPDIYTVLSNRLLTSLCSLQTSLDILRKHRPDYTPRTGFVWPIISNSMPDDNTKKRGPEAESAESDAETSVSVAKNSEAPKRQQNNMLLVNAMRATAAHSKNSFSSSVFAQNAESMAIDTPATTAIRSSATPAPAPPDLAAKAPSVSGSQDSLRLGGGKKKKKRTSLAAASAPAPS